MSDKSSQKRGEDAAAEKPGEPAAIRDEAREEAVGGGSSYDPYGPCKGIATPPQIQAPKPETAFPKQFPPIQTAT